MKSKIASPDNHSHKVEYEGTVLKETIRDKGPLLSQAS